MNETVMLYSKLPDDTGGCPFCESAKLYLNRNEIPFKEVQLDRPSRQIFYDGLGLQGVNRSVPQVVIIDATGERQLVGGYSALVNARVESLFHDPKERERADEQQHNATY